VWHRSHSSASPSPAPAVRASHCRTWQCRCRAARVRGRSPLLEPLPPRCYKSRASSSSSDFFTRTELPTSPLLFSVQVTGESSLLHFFLPIGSAPSARPHPARPCRSLVQHLHRSAATHRLSLPLRAPPPLATSGELPPPSLQNGPQRRLLAPGAAGTAPRRQQPLAAGPLPQSGGARAWSRLRSKLDGATGPGQGLAGRAAQGWPACGLKMAHRLFGIFN
jgi:hypothetical protein